MEGGSFGANVRSTSPARASLKYHKIRQFDSLGFYQWLVRWIEHEEIQDLETAYVDTDHLKHRLARDGCFVGEDLNI